MLARVSYQPLSQRDQLELDKTLASDGFAVMLQMVQARIAELTAAMTDGALSEPLPHLTTGDLSEANRARLREACAWKIFLDSIDEIRSGSLPRHTVRLDIQYEPRKSSPAAQPSPPTGSGEQPA